MSHSLLSSKHAKPQRILILGGTGFVGRALLARLALTSHTLICPTRHRHQNHDLLVYPSVKLIDADVHDVVQLRDLATQCDVIINLIGILNESGSESFQKNHTDLMQSLIEVAAELRIPRFIAMSSLGADATGPSEYLRSKGRAEQLLKQQPQLAWTILRPSVIFGPNDNFLNQFAALLRLAPVLPLARTQTRFAPVYVDDVAKAFVYCLQHADTAFKSYDIGGPEVLTLKELVLEVARWRGLRRLVLSLPDWLGYLQAWCLELLPNPPMSRDNFKSLAQDSVPQTNGLDALQITPHAMSALVPHYWRSS